MDDYLLKISLFAALSTFSRYHWRTWSKITICALCIYTVLRIFCPLPVLLANSALEAIFQFQELGQIIVIMINFVFEKGGIDRKLVAGFCLLSTIIVLPKPCTVQLIKSTVLAYFISTIKFSIL